VVLFSSTAKSNLDFNYASFNPFLCSLNKGIVISGDARSPKPNEVPAVLKVSAMFPMPIKDLFGASKRIQSSSNWLTSHSPSTPKRPSKIPSHGRQYQVSTQQTIKPLDPAKPCPFAYTPPEIREIIFEHVLPFTPCMVNCYTFNQRTTPASKLHVCRALRIEADYLYFSHTPFEVSAPALDFDPVMEWIDGLNRLRRSALSRNRNILIKLPRWISTRYVPLDRRIWAKCRHFGNLYSLAGSREQRRFHSYCRLAKWFLWCAKPSNARICWHYFVHREWREYRLHRGDFNSGRRKFLWRFLKQHLDAFIMFCTSGKYDPQGEMWANKGVIKEKALDMLTELDKAHENVREAGWKHRTSWDEEVERLTVCLKQWQ
jgi:hypothetical protein